MRAMLVPCLLGLLLVGCGDSEDGDGGTGLDSGDLDSGVADGGGGGGDGGGGSDAAAGDAGGSGAPCSSDGECTSGSEWCEGGRCVACDNSGLVCDIACSPDGWMTYMRNGCSPCDCGPPSECMADDDCAGSAPRTCYAGEFCWCAARTPDCCLGNICAVAGCPAPPPEGCRTRGCPTGQACQMVDGTCVSSSCDCGTGGTWSCTEDCGGGSCVGP